MSRYRQIGGYDDTILKDGDEGFLGVDMRREPNLLQMGACSRAENMRFINGVAETRKGLTPLAWATPLATAFPLEFPLKFNIKTAAGLGPILGAGRFSDPYGLESICFMVKDGAFFTTDHGVPVKVKLPAGETNTDRVFLLQAFEKLLAFRGENADPLIWDSTQPAGDLSAFSTIPDPENPNKIRIPRASSAETARNRIYIPFNRDEIAQSDVLDYGQYDPILNQFKLNKGEAGTLIRVFAWSETTLIGFKNDSIYAARNVYGDNSYMVVDSVPTEHGLAALYGVATVGPSIWYLSNGGIYALVVTSDNKLQSVAEPVSGPMQPMINRINWPYVGNACAEVWNNHYYLAVPIDDSRTNNCVLVYNILNQAWSGYDISPIMDVAFWVKTQCRGQERLVAVSSTGIAYLYEEGSADELGADYFGINSLLVTRGYMAETQDIKRWVRGTAFVSTWNPNYTITARVDGINETEVVRGPIGKDRRKYVRFGVPNYDTSNVNDDHGDPGREDYSVAIDSPINFGSGIILDRFQDFPEKFTMRRRGRFAQVEIRNTQGRIRVKGVAVEGYETARSLKTEVV